MIFQGTPIDNAKSLRTNWEARLRAAQRSDLKVKYRSIEIASCKSAIAALSDVIDAEYTPVVARGGGRVPVKRATQHTAD